MDVLISVVVPVYNMEKYLSRCVDSIINQTYTKLEIILVDDGSTDSSGRICDEYAAKDLRIKVIHKKNGGLSSARNAGFEVVSGSYVNFVDSDDWLELNSYEELANVIADPSNLKPDIIRFNAFKGSEVINKPPFIGLYEGDRLWTDICLPFIGSDQLGGLFITGMVWMDLYKSEFLRNNNIHFEIVKRYEDRLFTLRTFLQAKRIYFLDKPLYHYEYVPDSMSNKYDPTRWERELEYMDSMKRICLTDFSIPLDSIKDRLNNEYLLRCINSINHEYYSCNPNGFWKKYKNISRIIHHPCVVESSKKIKKNKTSEKESIMLFCIKYKCPLLLSVFEEFILFANKIKRKNG